MNNIPLVVGNRVTYKINDCIKTIIVTDQDDIEMLKSLEILNVEACLWEKVEYEEIKEEKTMDFGEAIKLLKEGKRLQRVGWNGKGQYIELATNISYINSIGELVNADHESIGNKAIAFVGTSGVQLGWLASQADMLAEDWKIVEE